jgi:hypothetical protein
MRSHHCRILADAQCGRGPEARVAPHLLSSDSLLGRASRECREAGVGAASGETATRPVRLHYVLNEADSGSAGEVSGFRVDRGLDADPRLEPPVERSLDPACG